MDRKKLLIIIGAVVLFLLIIFGVIYALTRKAPAPTPTPAPVCDPAKDPTCAPTPVNPSTADLTIWGVFDDSSTFDPLIREFNQQYPNIKVTFSKKQASDYESTLVDSIASGGGPDIFAVSNYWIPKHRSKMVAAPSEIWSTQEFNQNFIPSVYQDFVMDNKIYGVPLYTDNLALFYNPTLFGQANIYNAPKYWDDVLTYNKLLTKKVAGNPQAIDISGIALGTSDTVVRSGDILLALMLQSGTPMISTDQRTYQFNQFVKNAAGKENFPGTLALDFYTSFADPNRDSYSWNSSLGDDITAFANGKVAMILGYNYFVPSIQKINPELKYQIVPLPQNKSNPQNITVANYWGWSVSRNSKYQDAAWTFLKFLTQKQPNSEYLTATGRVSAQKNFANNSPATNIFENQKSYTQTIFKSDGDLFDTIFTEMIDDVTKFKQLPQDAINAADRKANDMLQSYY